MGSPDLPTPFVMARTSACASGFRRPDAVPTVDLVRLRSTENLHQTSILTTPVTVASHESPPGPPAVDDSFSDRRKTLGAVPGVRPRSPQQTRGGSHKSSPGLSKTTQAFSPRIS